MKTRIDNVTALVTIAFLTATSASGAVDIQAVARASIGISDNISRVPENTLDETIVSTGFDFAITETTRKFTLDLQSNVEYVDYRDNSFESEWIGGLRGEAVVTLVEERVRWNFQDTYGQQLFDPLQPEVPGNRENVNFFTTGPTIALSSSVRMPVDLEFEYTRVDFEERPQDNDRLSAAISIGRVIRRDALVSLNFSSERVAYDEENILSPAELYEAFVHYEVTGSRNSMSADVGYNQVEQGGIEGDGFLLRLSWTRRLTANGTFNLSAGSQYSNQGDIFQFYGGLSTDLRSTVDGSSGESPFLNHSLAASYVLATARYSVDISADWVKEDYEGGLGEDRDVYRGDLTLRREMSRVVYVEANLGLDRREFTTASRNDDDFVFGVGVGYRVSPGFSIALNHLHFRRDSTVPTAEFTENRTFLSFAYSPKWGRR